jgi:hypothetical protein
MINGQPEPGEKPIYCEEYNRPACLDCGEPAPHVSADGVPLCDGDYAELVRMAEVEGWA